MNVCIRIDPGRVWFGSTVSGSIQLSPVASPPRGVSSPLELSRSIEQSSASVSPVSLSVSLIGRCKQPGNNVDRILFESSAIQVVTAHGMQFQIRLPDQADSSTLPPSFHRGIAYRYIYCLQVEVGHPNSQLIRRFRLPVSVPGPASGRFEKAEPTEIIAAEWTQSVLLDETSKRDQSGSPQPRGVIPHLLPLPKPGEDSMMENILDRLESLLRAEFDDRGWAQPEADWHHISPIFEDAFDEIDGQLNAVPSWFRLRHNENNVCRVLIAQNQVRLGGVVRGRFFFDAGGLPCLSINATLLSIERENQTGTMLGRVNWNESRFDSKDISSLEFAIPLPDAPDAAATFINDLVSLDWSIDFRFMLVGGDEYQWTLPLKVHCLPILTQSTIKTFFIHRHELPIAQ